MGIYRFVAPDTQRAMQKIHDELGPEAFIYSTRRTTEGVEMLAGLTDDIAGISTEVQVQNVAPDPAFVDRLNTQLQVMDESLIRLTNHVNALSIALTEKLSKKRMFKWNVFGFFKQLTKFNKEGRYGKQTAH